MISEEEELREIREDILSLEPKPKPIKVKILYDKASRQYSIKIPKDLAEAAEIDPLKQVFEFMFTPADPRKPESKNILTAELKEGVVESVRKKTNIQ